MSLTTSAWSILHARLHQRSRKEQGYGFLSFRDGDPSLCATALVSHAATFLRVLHWALLLWPIRSAGRHRWLPLGTPPPLPLHVALFLTPIMPARGVLVAGRSATVYRRGLSQISGVDGSRNSHGQRSAFLPHVRRQPGSTRPRAFVCCCSRGATTVPFWLSTSFFAPGFPRRSGLCTAATVPCWDLYGTVLNPAPIIKIENGQRPVAERIAQIPRDRLQDQRRLEVPALKVVLGPTL